MNKDRLLSLDVFRGLTIAAMILVNEPGSWSYVYAPLLHAKWHGCTPTDLIFPFFLFMVGMAISLGRPKTGEERKSATKKILKRSFYLIIIGLFLNGFPFFDFNTIRIPGVLQRIGLVFLVVALMYHYLSIKAQAIIGGALLIIYWIMMAFIPVPGIGPASFDVNSNFAAWFDRLILMGHMWDITETWDPEGLFTTIPAIGSAIIGVIAGYILFKHEDKKSALLKLFVLANVLICSGLIWDMVFPFNKNLWSSSYVLYTGGIAIHFYAVLYWFLDIKKHKSSLAYPFVVFGSNAITVYSFSMIMEKSLSAITIGENSILQHFYNAVCYFISDNYLSSLVYAVCFVLVSYLPVWIMFRKKIFIKV